MLLLAAVTLPSCQSTFGETYTLVLLRTGPASPTTEQRRELLLGHFANMRRLAKEQHLLVAGPYGEDKHANDLSGIFVLDTADRAEAQALAETDPTVQAGVFELEYHDFQTDAPLRTVLARDLARLQAAEAAGREVQNGEGARAYVLLTADYGDRALQELDGHAAVLLRARVDGKRALFVLDATRPDQVAGLLNTVLPRIGSYVLDSWYASGQLAELPRPVSG